MVEVQDSKGIYARSTSSYQPPGSTGQVVLRPVPIAGWYYISPAFSGLCSPHETENRGTSLKRCPK